MIFTFKSKFQGFGSPESTLEFEADSLDDVLMYFKQFLHGSGYHFEGDVIIDQETWPIDEANRQVEEHFMNLAELKDAN